MKFGVDVNGCMHRRNNRSKEQERKTDKSVLSISPRGSRCKNQGKLLPHSHQSHSAHLAHSAQSPDIPTARLQCSTVTSSCSRPSYCSYALVRPAHTTLANSTQFSRNYTKTRWQIFVNKNKQKISSIVSIARIEELFTLFFYISCSIVCQKLVSKAKNK